MKQRKIDDRELEEISGAGGFQNVKPAEPLGPLPKKDSQSSGGGGGSPDLEDDAPANGPGYGGVTQG